MQEYKTSCQAFQGAVLDRIFSFCFWKNTEEQLVSMGVPRRREAASSLDARLVLGNWAEPMLDLDVDFPCCALLLGEAIHCAGNLGCPSLFGVFSKGDLQITFSHAHNLTGVP